jgi:hypothetical protein
MASSSIEAPAGTWALSVTVAGLDASPTWAATLRVKTRRATVSRVQNRPFCPIRIKSTPGSESEETVAV